VEHSFPCGNTALDFLGTLKARRNDVPRETLSEPASLKSWLRESGVVDGDTECGPADLTAAVALREAIYSLVAARLFGNGYDDNAVDLLNDVARRPAAIPQLTATGRRTEATAEQALSSIARDAIAILGGSDADLLKECSRPECTQVYLDHSRGGRREWCAMETCGNKMKARAYRARKKATA
jgi:predicted RNA-binding Zn ribbon-like protein